MFESEWVLRYILGLKIELKQDLLNDVVAMINYKSIEMVTSQTEFDLKLLEAQQLQLKLLLEIINKLQE